MTARVGVKLTTRLVYDGHNYSNGYVCAHPAATNTVTYLAQNSARQASFTRRHRVVNTYSFVEIFTGVSWRYSMLTTQLHDNKTITATNSVLSIVHP